MGATMPVEFTPQIAELVCDRILEGKTQQCVAVELGCSPALISKWKAKHPLFAAAVDAARAESSHVLVDEARDIADKDPDSKRAKNRIHVRLFAAERLNRKAYGQAIDMTLTQQVDVGGTLIEARKRVVLPGCDLTQIPAAQATDYVMLPDGRTADTQSVTATSNPIVDPFE
jgi:hypothetical protein